MNKLIIFIALFLIVTTVSAETIRFINPVGVTSFTGFISAILEVIVRFGAIIVVLFFVITGFMFVTAQGDPEKLTLARNMLFGTVIGALLILGAFAISRVICRTATSVAGINAGAIGGCPVRPSSSD